MTNQVVVVKVGTSSVTDDRGVIDQSAVGKIAAEVAALRAGGLDVVVVSASSAGRPTSPRCRRSPPPGRRG